MTIIETTASQISAAGIRPTHFVKVDDATLRTVTKRGRGVRSVDVRYDAGMDLYDVTVSRFSTTDYEVTTAEPVCGVFAEQMVEMVRG